MKKSLNRILICVILYFSWQNASAQRLQNFLYSEIHLVAQDSITIVYYSFRIPYDRFVFLKNGNEYTAKFRISLEVTDSLSNHVTRQTEDKVLETDNFDETLSKDTYSEGTISFNVKTGIYHLLPIITELNSNKDLRLPSLIVDASKKDFSEFYTPIVVDEDKYNCGGNDFFKLTNYDNFIPFSEKSYSLIIPTIDSTLKYIKVAIIKGTDTLYNNTISQYFNSYLSFSECNNEILLKQDSAANSKQRIFVVTNFSQKLPEGDYVIYIFKNSETKPVIHFPIAVVWFNKPFSLRNPKEAISDLQEIENADLVDSLLSMSSNVYEKELFNYWKKYDSTPETAFNPLMNEFYLRVDYAAKEFSTISRKNGAATDRGKIFIKYGKPQKIERTSNEYGKMVEKWIYEKPFRAFEFVEKDGTGNYTLIKS